MKMIARILGGLVALIALAIGAAALFFDADQFRPRVEAALTNALHRETHLGKFSLSLRQGKIAADGVSIAEDPAFGTVPFLRAKSIALQVEWWPLISERKLNVLAIAVTEPVIVLAQNKRGVWNVASTGPAAPPNGAGSASGATSRPLQLSVKLLEISKARVTIGELENAKLLVLENVTLTVRDFSPLSAFPFTASGTLATGGDVALEGTAGPIQAESLPVQLSAKVNGLKLEPYGVGGLLSLQGKGSMDGRKLDWTGTARLERAKLSAKGQTAKVPIIVDFTVSHSLQRHFGAIQRGAIHAGKAAAAFTGSYAENNQRFSVNMHVTANSMPIPDLVALLPVFDVQLPAGSSLEGGALSADLMAVGAATEPDISGTIDVDKTRLAGFDMGTKMGLLERLAGIQPSPNTDIEKLDARLRTGRNGTEIRELDLVIPAMGELTGEGTVSPTHQLSFRMKAAVHTRGALMTAIGQRHDTVIPFFIQGTSMEPQFRADAGAIAASELERLRGTSLGGVDVGKAVDVIKGIFGGEKKQ